MERLDSVKHVFLLNQEGIGREKHSEKGTDVVEKIRVLEMGVASDDRVPRVLEIATEDVASFLVTVDMVDVEVGRICGVDEVFDDANEAFFVGRIGAERGVLLFEDDGVIGRGSACCSCCGQGGCGGR